MIPVYESILRRDCKQVADGLALAGIATIINRVRNKFGVFVDRARYQEAQRIVWGEEPPQEAA